MLSKQFALILTWAFAFSLLAQAAPSVQPSLSEDFRLSKRCTDSLIRTTKRNLGKGLELNTVSTGTPTIWYYDEEHYQVSLQGNVNMDSCLVMARLGQRNEQGEYNCEAIEATDCHDIRMNPDTSIAFGR